MADVERMIVSTPVDGADSFNGGRTVYARFVDCPNVVMRVNV